MTLFLLSAALLGQIEGPDRIAVYTLGEYHATGGEKSSYMWEVPPGLSAKQLDQFGISQIVTGAPGAYQLKVLEIGPSGNDQRPFVIIPHVKHITIDGTGPGPNPSPTPPNPTPGPVPPIPTPTPTPPGPPGPGVFGLTGIAFSEADKIQQPARAQAPEVARAARSLADDLRDGKFTNARQLGRETQARLLASFGDYRREWMPFSDALYSRLQQITQASKLTKEQGEAAFIEVAVGVEAVKK